MKKKLTIGGIIAVCLIGLVFIVALFLPCEFRVSRDTVIDAPPELVFGYVNDLHYYNKWSPWVAADTSMKLTISESTAGKGAWYSWTSDNSGFGKMTIIDSTPPHLVRAAYEFEGGKMTATSEFILEPVADGTRITWAIDGDDGGRLIHRYFSLLMDSMVGPHFEDGLASLKQMAESAPPQ